MYVKFSAGVTETNDINYSPTYSQENDLSQSDDSNTYSPENNMIQTTIRNLDNQSGI